MENVFKGEPFAYCEMGTEGIIWSLQLDGLEGYDGLFCIKPGDHLAIYSVDDSENSLWQGTIDYEREREIYLVDPQYPEYKKESKLCWNRGIQKGVSCFLWQEWFNSSGKYFGVVTRKENE